MQNVWECLRERRSRAKAMAALFLALGLAILVSACGESGNTEDEKVAAAEIKKPATGTLSVFAYEDSVTPEMMEPFQEQNPDLKIKTATFDSNAEAAAKLAAGFDVDVVEVCMDEAKPLTQRNLVRALDTDLIPDWDSIVFHDNPDIRQDGEAIMVPLSAGPHGMMYLPSEVPEGVDSFTDLYNPKFKGRTNLESDYALPPMAVTALALGIEDPMNLTQEQIEQVRDYMIEHRDQFRSLSHSDSEVVNLFKSGEVVVSNGGRAVADRLNEEGVPVKWVVPKERAISWVCGFGITSNAKNLPAAYRLINWQASPESQAIRAKNGYIVTNEKAMPKVPEKYKESADPSMLDHAIPETHPPHFEEWTKAFQQFQTG